MGNPRRFTSQESNLVISLGNEITLTSDEHVVKAECIKALKTVESNRSFASADGDNVRYGNMFPDSDIAKIYRQGATKLKYNI